MIWSRRDANDQSLVLAPQQDVMTQVVCAVPCSGGLLLRLLQLVGGSMHNFHMHDVHHTTDEV